MVNQDEVRRLLKKGVDAARDGDRETAVRLLQQVTDLDSSNERAWYLLANLTDDPEQKRIYLENVLYVNPNNEKAQQMLDRLGGNAPAQPTGTSSRRMLYVGAGAVIVWIILEAVLLGTGQVRRQNATATSVAFNATATQQRLILDSTAAANATASQIALEETQQAATGAVLTLTATFAGTATPTFDPTQLTPPPTWTPTPLPGDAAAAPPTPTEVGAERLLPPPPPEQFDGQFIVAWGGQDVESNGFLQLRLYPLAEEGQFRVVDNVRVNSVDINPTNGETLIYSRFFSSRFLIALERSNPAGTQAQLVGDVWRGIEVLFRETQPQFSLDGTKVVFMGDDEFGSAAIWLLDLNSPPVPNQAPLTQLTTDNAVYSFPSISPDGSRVVVARVEPESISPEPDLYMIDVETLEQTRLTFDGDALVETHTRFEPSGNAVAYVGSPESADAPGDIIRLLVNSPDAPAFPIVRDPETDERRPVYSPDGRYLAYASDRTGAFNIFILDLETEEEFQLTAEDRDDVFPGGWYQPGVIDGRPAVFPLPTPVIISEEEGEQPPGDNGAVDEPLAQPPAVTEEASAG